MQQIIWLWRKGCFLLSMSSLSFPDEIWSSFLCFSTFCYRPVRACAILFWLTFSLPFSLIFHSILHTVVHMIQISLIPDYFICSFTNLWKINVMFTFTLFTIHLEFCLAAQRYNALSNLQHLRCHFCKDPAKQIVVLGFQTSCVCFVVQI